MLCFMVPKGCCLKGEAGIPDIPEAAGCGSGAHICPFKGSNMSGSPPDRVQCLWKFNDVVKVAVAFTLVSLKRVLSQSDAHMPILRVGCPF